MTNQQQFFLASGCIFPYLWVMKTTIELPDDLFLKMKVLAAERRTTLKELMIVALNSLLQAPAASEEKLRKASLTLLLKSMQAHNTERMVPMTREELYDR